MKKDNLLVIHDSNVFISTKSFFFSALQRFHSDQPPECLGSFIEEGSKNSRISLFPLSI